MPRLTYSFFPDIWRDPKSQKLITVFRPYIPVKLSHKKKRSEHFINALVDSGADGNLFPAQLAYELGIKVEKGFKSEHYGIGEANVIAYSHIVQIDIGSKIIETVIDFSENISTPLLGRNGFFLYFNRVAFKVKDKLLELKY